MAGNIPRAIQHFADIGRRYCNWAEEELGDPHEAMRRAQLLLAELHLAAIQLPELKLGDDVKPTHISHEDWSVIFKRFALLPVTSYIDVFNPLKDKDPIESSLSDDLADIWRDVKTGLNLFDADHPIDAAWEWRLNFQVHWGQHLVGAQRAIHEYLSDDML
jgi:hypothetical protein